MNISELFQKIKNTSSTNEKIKALKFYNNLGHDNIETLKDVLKLVYSGDVIFGITSKNIQMKSQGFLSDFPMQVYNELLRTEGRNAKIQLIELKLGNYNRLVQEYFLRGLDKDLGIGISAKSINKAFPDLINLNEIMLAHKADPEDFERLFSDTSYVYVNLKIDGIRATCEVKDGKATFVSRDGHNLPEFLLENIKNEIETQFKDITIKLDGEIYADDFQNLMKIVQRKKIDLNNTIIRNQCKYAIFDIIQENTILENRLTLMESLLVEGTYVKIVKYVKVKRDYQFLLKLARKYIERGNEGIMVKHPLSKYEYKRSKMWMKFKNKNTEDLKVISLVEGEKGTKYEGQLGAVLVDFHGVQVSVGSGFTDAQRKEFWNNKDRLLDKIIEVSYMEITKDKSMRHPVFERLRDDRS